MGSILGYEAYELSGSGSYMFSKTDVSATRKFRVKGNEAVAIAAQLWWRTVNRSLALPPVHPRLPFVYIDDIKISPLSEKDKVELSADDGMILNQWCQLELTYKSLDRSDGDDPDDPSWEAVFIERKKFGGEIMTIPASAVKWQDDDSDKDDPTQVWIGQINLDIEFPNPPGEINEDLLYSLSGKVNNATWRHVPEGHLLFTGASTETTISTTSDFGSFRTAKSLTLGFVARSIKWNEFYKPNTGWTEITPALYTAIDFDQFYNLFLT